MAGTVSSNLSFIGVNADAESDSNWNNGTLQGDIFIQGSNSVGSLIKQSDTRIVYTNSSETLDLSAPNTHVYIWGNCTTAGLLATKASGGIVFRLSDSTDPANNGWEWFLEGSDTYSGGWKSWVIDVNSTPDVIVGSGVSNLATVGEVGLSFDVPGMVTGNNPNCFVDAIRQGDGADGAGALVVTGGTQSDPVTWQDIIDADEGTVANKYGVVRTDNEVVFVKGPILIGSGVSPIENTYFDDQDRIVVYEAANPTGGVSDTWYQLRGGGHSTVDTTIKFGAKLGDGDDAVGTNGIVVQSAGPKLEIDFSDADIDETLMYGTTFRVISEGVKFSSDATHGPNHEVISCTFDQSGQIDPGRAAVRNCLFSATTHALNSPFTTVDGSAMLWNDDIDIKNCSFNANSDATSDPHGIEHPTGGTYTYDNLTFSGNDFDIHLNTLVSPCDLVIDAINGSNPVTSDVTSPCTVTINNSVTVSITVKETSGLTVFGAQVYVVTDPGGQVLIDAATGSDGLVSTTFNYSVDTDIIIRVRKSSPTDPTRYIPVSTSGTITINGFSLTVVLTEDPNVV